jgi:(p)ppGpp synthase/HD superfamily hydrolase
MSLFWSQECYIEAYHFAAWAHQSQLVKGSNLPYITHPTLVSMEIMAALTVEKVTSPDLAVQCALLHDVLEDTQVTYEQLKLEFGAAVAEGVLALSKDPELDKAIQMEDCLTRIQAQPIEIWMVKMADRITNLQEPPAFWTNARRSLYRDEAIRIHAALKNSNPYLANRLQEKIKNYSIYIKA